MPKSRGPIEHVKCPYCEDYFDLSDAVEELSRGVEIECDGCHKRSRVASMGTVTMVTLETI